LARQDLTAVGRSESRNCVDSVPVASHRLGRDEAGSKVSAVPRLPRSKLPDGVYHVTARGAGRAAIFLDDLDRSAFIHRLRRTVTKFEWRCHAYCLMTNHYHLVVETTIARLSAGMQRLNGNHAQQFNARQTRTGHVFESRFSSRLVDRESHLQDACEYVLENPVRAGLCRRAEDWPWSGGAGDL
jgi:putative transposase